MLDQYRQLQDVTGPQRRPEVHVDMHGRGAHAMLGVEAVPVGSDHVAKPAVRRVHGEVQKPHGVGHQRRIGITPLDAARIAVRRAGRV